MSVTVHPTMGLPPQNGVVGEKLTVAVVGSELPPSDEEYPLLSYGECKQYKKEEDFAVAKTDCERVPGDPSTTYAAFMVQFLIYFLIRTLSFNSRKTCIDRDSSRVPQ